MPELSNDISLSIPSYDDARALARLQMDIVYQTYVVELGVYTQEELKLVYGTPDAIVKKWQKRLTDCSLRTDKYFIYIALDKKRIVGYIFGWKQEKSSKVILSKLYISSPYQGKGIASLLMEMFFSWSGNRVVYVLVEHTNIKAIRFYEKHGFSQTCNGHESAGMVSIWLKRVPALAK